MVLRPTLNALIYGSIFGIMQGSNMPSDYPAFIVIGVFLFEFFSQSMTNGATSITRNRALVQSLAFPRMALPTAVVIQQFLSLVPMLGVMVVALVILGDYPTWSWLLMIPLVAVFSLFNFGVALVSARLTVHLRDLTQLLPFISRLLFYTSGVLFDVDRILARWPWLVTAYDFHPIYQVLSLARAVLMGSREVDPMFWVYLTGWSVLTLVLGVLFFWAAEERYGRD